MLTRRRWLALGAATLATLARGARSATSPGEVIDPRPTLAVTLNGRGPFRLIADSAAQGLALSRAVAETLKLPEAAQSVAIIGSTGSVPRGARQAERLDAGALHWSGTPAAILDRHALIEADGILGLAGLPALVAHYRFRERTALVQARSDTSPPTSLRLPISVRKGDVPAVEMQLRDAAGRTHRLQAVIDTGAERSVGNTALAKLAGPQPSAAAPSRNRTLTGASGETILATDTPIGTLKLDKFEWGATVIATADLPAFQDWGLNATPALLLGIDLLSRLEALSIDHDRREVLLSPP